MTTQEIAREVTLIALREELMEYFTGSTKKITDGNGVRVWGQGWQMAASGRVELNERNEGVLMLHYLDICHLAKNPSEVRWLIGSASPDIVYILKGLSKAVSQYLPEVKQYDTGFRLADSYEDYSVFFTPSLLGADGDATVTPDRTGVFTMSFYGDMPNPFGDSFSVPNPYYIVESEPNE